MSTLEPTDQDPVRAVDGLRANRQAFGRDEAGSVPGIERAVVRAEPRLSCGRDSAHRRLIGAR